MKGSIFDIIFLSVMFVVIASGLIITHYVFSQTRAELVAENFTAGELAMTDNALGAMADWNVIFLFLLVGSSMATVVSAFAVRSHPIFFIVFFLVQVVAVYLATPLQAVYTTITADPTMNASVALFPWITTTVSNLPLLTLAFSALVALVMFALPGEGGRQL